MHVLPAGFIVRKQQSYPCAGKAPPGQPRVPWTLASLCQLRPPKPNSKIFRLDHPQNTVKLQSASVQPYLWRRDICGVCGGLVVEPLTAPFGQQLCSYAQCAHTGGHGRVDLGLSQHVATCVGVLLPACKTTLNESSKHTLERLACSHHTITRQTSFTTAPNFGTLKACMPQHTPGSSSQGGRWSCNILQLYSWQTHPITHTRHHTACHNHQDMYRVLPAFVPKQPWLLYRQTGKPPGQGAACKFNQSC